MDPNQTKTAQVPEAQEFNFNTIFTGTMDEQADNASIFSQGLKSLLRDAAKYVADAVLSAGGESQRSALARASTLTRAAKAFHDDSRTRRIVAWIEDQKRQKQADDFRAHLNRVVEEVVGRG